MADIATRSDIAAIRSEMATAADLAQLETKIIKWLVPLLLGRAGLIVALTELLP